MGGRGVNWGTGGGRGPKSCALCSTGASRGGGASLSAQQGNMDARGEASSSQAVSIKKPRRHRGQELTTRSQTPPD